MTKLQKIALASLGAAILLLLGLYLALTSAGQAEEESGTPLFALSGEVDQVTYEKEEPITLRRTEEGWILNTDPQLPLKQTEVNALQEKIASLTAVRTLAPGEIDGETLGFDTPSQQITLEADGQEYTVVFGKLNETANVYYARTSDGTIYTVYKSDLDDLFPSVRSLYQPQHLTDFSSDEITGMRVDQGSFVLEFTKEGDTWQWAEDPEKPLHQSNVERMARTACEMGTEWTITAPEGDASYGLDTPQLTVEVTFTDGRVLRSLFGDVVEQGSSKHCYLSTSAAPGVVYEVNAAYLSAFSYTEESLATAETASAQEKEEADVIAEHPVGGRDDYAD